MESIPSQVLDQLGAGQLATVVHFLETLVSIDEDGDTLGSAEREAIDEEWLEHHETDPAEDILAEFGLTMADWNKMGERPLPEETPHRDG